MKRSQYKEYIFFNKSVNYTATNIQYDSIIQNIMVSIQCHSLLRCNWADNCTNNYFNLLQSVSVQLYMNIPDNYENSTSSTSHVFQDHMLP